MRAMSSSVLGQGDLVARLGSRASVPSEVRSRWGVADYAALMGHDDVEQGLVRRLDRNVREIGRLDPGRLRAVATALARPPAAELNQARIAATAGLPATTLPPYLTVLERLGLIRALPGTTAIVAKRAVARPVVVFDDPAVARHLAGVRTPDLVEMRGRRYLAPLLKGLAVAALLRQQESSAVSYRLGHLRERNGLKVDVVVEMPDDTVYGIEIRTAGAFRPHQFRALEALATRAGPRFRGGVVLSTAPVGFRFRPGLWGLPVSALWDWDT